MTPKRKHPDGQKKVKKSKQSSALRWKPMAIECTEGLEAEDFAGLVGLEELDVDVSTFTGGQIINGGKRRYSEKDLDDDSEPEMVIESAAKKKKQKKQKAKAKKNAKVEVERTRSVSEATTIDINDDLSSLADENEDDLDAAEEVEEVEDDVVAVNSDLDMSAWSSLSVPEHIISRLRVLGMSKPTPIQTETIAEAITSRTHVYGAAPTGSGKTLAFAIPMVAHIIEDKESEDDQTVNTLRGLVLTPTRELAVQIKKHIECITQATGSQPATLRTALVVGGLSIQKQERVLSKQKPDIVIATPGRLWEIITSGSVPFLNRASLSTLSYLVVDEADRMIERGHFEELKLVIGLLNETPAEERPISRQVFIFSATLTLEKKEKTGGRKNKKKKECPNLIETLHLDPNQIKVVDLTEGGVRSTPGGLSEYILHTMKDDKDMYLYYFLQANPGRTIVFCNSIDCIRRLLNLLRFLGLTPLAVHSSMPQKRRLTSIERFTSSKEAILLATDVAARGLDIPSVNHVVHYQCPRTAEIYVHRSGRTARIDQTGLSLILCDPTEEAFFLKDFCRILNKPKGSLLEYETNSKALRRCKERVKLATVCDQLEHGLRKERTEENWFKEAAKAAEMDDSDEESDTDPDENAALRAKASNSRKLKAYKGQLDAMLKSKIVFNKDFIK